MSKLEDLVASITDDGELSTQSPCLTSVPSGVTDPQSDDGLPPAVCTYYANSMKGIGQGCLRVNCKFFHGTEEQLADLRIRCLLDEPLAAGVSAVGIAKRRKNTATDVLDDNATKRPIVCLNFLSNTCHRGECRFLHLPPTIRPLPMTTCEYFLRGNCTRVQCRFFHGDAQSLQRLHTDGVTMYNPLTNCPYDPKVPVEELMRLVAERPICARPSCPPSYGHRPAPPFAQGHCFPTSYSSAPMPSPPQRQHQPQLAAPAPTPSQTIYMVVDSVTKAVLEVHSVTQQADGSVTVVSPSPAYNPQAHAPGPQVGHGGSALRGAPFVY